MKTGRQKAKAPATSEDDRERNIARSLTFDAEPKEERMLFRLVTIKDGKEPLHTDLDFPDVAKARSEAMRALGAMVRDQADRKPSETLRSK